MEISYTKTLVDFRVKRNDTFRKKIKFSTKINAVITNEVITSSQFTMKIADKISGGTLVKELTIGNGLTFGETGVLIAEISAANMNLQAAVYYYDISRIYPDGTVVTRPEGRFIIDTDV